MESGGLIGRVGTRIGGDDLSTELINASAKLMALIEPAAYVGEVYSIGYDEALVQIHDFNRQQVGGIPALSFLVATRVDPAVRSDVRTEDASVLARARRSAVSGMSTVSPGATDVGATLPRSGDRRGCRGRGRRELRR